MVFNVNVKGFFLSPLISFPLSIPSSLFLVSLPDFALLVSPVSGAVKGILQKVEKRGCFSKSLIDLQRSQVRQGSFSIFHLNELIPSHFGT